MHQIILQFPLQLAQDAQAVLQFWFDEKHHRFWFNSSPEFDEKIKHFQPLIDEVAKGHTQHWRQHILGRVAEIIVLDQFSRNLYRHTPQAFAYDPLALILAQEIINQTEFATLTLPYRQFALMPFMHSESAKIQQQSIELFRQLGNQTILAFALQHQEIINRFGRYPHRNAQLNRPSTLEETQFLAKAKGFW